jgi:carboxyl-terminal processing protease
VRVANIIPGSPCWKQGDLKEGDLILKVGQGNEEPVDITDWRVDEAVKLIRGKKGTEVRLTVKHLDGSTEVISIIRDVVIIEETYAKSAVLQLGDVDAAIGYIHLPKFYADFSNAGGRNSAEDMKREVKKLRNENVKGIIIDLRNNGGGSLQDVVSMAGLFIPQGPVVQVRPKANATATTLDDYDSTVTYRGPLVILVNEFSASASEILAAAMQDYKRAVIIGSSATFGKGTVQQFFELDKMVARSMDHIKPLGSIKITTQKFYRINGNTTQLTGVVPDIVLPDQYQFFDLGERDYDHALEPDKIPAANYKTWTLTASQLLELQKNSEKRVSNNPVFQSIEDYARQLKDDADNSTVSLAWTTFEQSQDAQRSSDKDFDDLLKPIDGLLISIPGEDEVAIRADSVKVASWEKFEDRLRKDVYLLEAIYVLSDMRN